VEVAFFAAAGRAAAALTVFVTAAAVREGRPAFAVVAVLPVVLDRELEDEAFDLVFAVTEREVAPDRFLAAMCHLLAFTDANPRQDTRAPALVG
jgi:hypothetical protein